MAGWVILQSPEFKDWYRTSLTDEERDANIPIAEAIYDRHLAGLAEVAPSQRPERMKRGRKR